MRYRIALHSSDEGFSASVPGLPGCWPQGATEAEAIENIKVAIEENLAVTAVRLKREQIQLVVDGDAVGTGVDCPERLAARAFSRIV